MYRLITVQVVTFRLQVMGKKFVVQVNGPGRQEDRRSNEQEKAKKSEDEKERKEEPRVRIP